MNLLLEVITHQFCGEDHHTFETRGSLPIPDTQLCCCGRVTWAEAVEAAEQKLKETKNDTHLQPHHKPV